MSTATTPEPALQIDVWFDLICPWCLIGKTHLDRALESRPDHPFQIQWHPFQLNPDMPKEGVDHVDYLADKFGGPQRAVQILANGATLATDLTRDRIHDSFGTPSAISFWNLPTYIAGLERAGFSARSHLVWYQIELAQPLLLAAMVLIAAGFTMRHARMAQTGVLVLLALLAGFGVFFLRNFGQVLGENGQIPVILAAWSPPLAAVLLALGFLLLLEDG
mgnify:CR=1 FL=1